LITSLNKAPKNPLMENFEKNKKSSGQVIKPLQQGLIKAIASLRKDGGDIKKRYVIAKSMLALGRLINSWKDVVGVVLASHTYPYRLIKGRLFLAVSDSQWMQTLTFLRSEIISKLNNTFPDMKITEICARVGVIPEEVKRNIEESIWPDWREEPITEVKGVKDKDLAEGIKRCCQKSSARIKGLTDKGYKLCIICRAVPTRSSDGVCAMCLYKSQESTRLKATTLISEMPWLTYEEVSESGLGLSELEYNSIKEDLYSASDSLITELGKDLSVEFDEETFAQLQKEITRAIILRTGCMPDRVDLSDIKSLEFFDARWYKYLKPFIGEGG